MKCVIVGSWLLRFQSETTHHSQHLIRDLINASCQQTASSWHHQEKRTRDPEEKQCNSRRTTRQRGRLRTEKVQQDESDLCLRPRFGTSPRSIGPDHRRQWSVTAQRGTSNRCIIPSLTLTNYRQLFMVESIAIYVVVLGVSTKTLDIGYTALNGGCRYSSSGTVFSVA